MHIRLVLYSMAKIDHLIDRIAAERNRLFDVYREADEELRRLIRQHVRAPSPRLVAPLPRDPECDFDPECDICGDECCPGARGGECPNEPDRV